MLKKGLECTKRQLFRLKKMREDFNKKNKPKIVKIQIVYIAMISLSHLKCKCLKMEP